MFGDKGCGGLGGRAPPGGRGLLPQNFDYSTIEGLRLEAREKLNKIKPLNMGQASRISGVSPADIAVLTVYLKSKKLI